MARSPTYRVAAHWSRFVVKQTFEQLKPKRTFTPYVPGQGINLYNLNINAAIHGPQTIQHGWEWYEMGFFTYWHPSGATTLLCFDLPGKMRTEIQSVFTSHTINHACPHSLFALISEQLVRVYNDSVWSIRNHISQWEAVRVLLHASEQETVD